MTATPPYSITYLSFQQLVQLMSSQWTADTNITPVLNPGDPVLALFEAGAAQGIQLENLAQAVQLMARLSTSYDGDVDSFVNDFGVTRLPATAATGQVTFTASSVATSQILIPLGTIVQTQGGAVQYQTIADTTQPAYNPSLQAYVIPIGQTSCVATVQSIATGSDQNVQANQLNQLSTAISGIATVTNTSAITNALDEETDAALKARFVAFLASLSEATYAAIVYAITSVQQGLQYVILENTNTLLETQYGFFTVVIDNGTGNPPSSLLTAVSSAINNIRAFTIRYAVIGPIVETVTVQLNIRSSGVLANDEATAQAAVLNYVNSRTMGQSLNIADIIDVVMNSSPTITNVQVSSVLINGLNQDFAVTSIQETKTSSVIVGSY